MDDFKQRLREIEASEFSRPVDSPPETVTHTTTIEFHRPWCYPEQLTAIYDPRRLSFIEASTKSGKTHGCIGWLAEKALLGGGNGRNYWWVAPVSDQANIAFVRMMRTLPIGTFTANRTSKTIVLMNGAIIWFKSADRPDSLYGEDVYAAVVDEASRAKEDAWIAVSTTLTATQGPARIIGNVKGRKNWFYRLARIAQSRNCDPANFEFGYHRITVHQAIAAGVVPASELDASKERLRNDAVWRELYLAEAQDDFGNPFGLEFIHACARPLSSKQPRVWGWDLAKKHDFTV